MALPTATWLPGPWGYRLDAANVITSVTWYRAARWPDGRVSSLKLGAGTPLYDLTVPLDDATVFYTAIDGTGAVSIPALTPPTPTLPILAATSNPNLTAALVTVKSQREQAIQGRTEFYDVLDAHEPLAETLPPTQRTGTLTLDVPHPPSSAFPGQTLTALRRMLRSGEILTLRTICHERVENLTFAFLTWTESNTGPDQLNHHGPDRTIEIQWRATNPIWGPEITVARRIWGTVPIEFATWGDVPAAVPTWGELVTG